jgi:hypothetical protein
MRSFLAAAALLSLALAGCSGGSPDSAAPSASASSSATMTSTAPPVPTSDTLHFLAAPQMAPRLPSGSPEAATPVTVGNFGQSGGPQAGAQWTYLVKQHTNVTAGEVHVWINIKDTLFDNPGTPAQPQCTWRLTTAIGADIQPIRSCVNEPPGPIAAGTKELLYTLVLDSPVELEANETVSVRLDRSAFSPSPNNSVDALSGSADHDSRITLKGLQEPAP